MSLCYVLVCRRQPPRRAGGWAGHDVEGTAVLELAPEALAPALRRQLDQDIVLVLEFSGPARANWTIVEQYIKKLADITAGEVFYEDGWERVYLGSGDSGWDLLEFEAWWDETRRAHETACEARKAKEQAKYEHQWAEDPTGMQEAIDWSDVMPDVEVAVRVRRDLILVDAGPKPIAVVKTLRERRPELTLSQAWALVHSDRPVLFAQATEEEAERMVQQVEAAGGTIVRGPA